MEAAPPRVTVLMTTYNGARFIAESIASILAQSFADFELLIVDDGSTDATPAIIAGIPDPRLRVITAARNGGIVAARNLGFAAARGRLIAALDHDDLSDPRRLACEVAYLDAHPEVVLVGSCVRVLGPDGVRPPDRPGALDALAMRWQLLIDNPLTWASVMFRAEAIGRVGGFMRAEFEPADDFDLYHRLLAVGEIARIAPVLTTYRQHRASASHTQAAALNGHAARVLAAAHAPYLGAAAAAGADLVIRHLSDRQPVRDAATLERLGACLETLLDGFCRAHRVTGAARTRIARLAGRAWWSAVRAAVRSGAPGLLRCHRRAPTLAAAFRPSLVDRASSAAIGAVHALRARS